MRTEERRADRLAAGFTLIEILVVMAIMSTLAAMVVGGVRHAMIKAHNAKARANLAALCVALDTYGTVTGRLPGGDVPGPAKDDPWTLFVSLCSGNPAVGGSRDNHLEDWPGEAIGRWRGSFDDVYERASDDDLDFTHGVRARSVLLDPWGHAYHYVELESRPPEDRRLASGRRFPRAGQRYAVWSDGPDGIDEGGEGDDVASWRE